MNDLNQLDGLNDFLAGIYEMLREHESLLCEMSASAFALQKLLERNPPLVDEFQNIRRQIKREQLEPRYVMKLRLIDEIIARLRGM